MRSPLFMELSAVMMLGKTKISGAVDVARTNGRDEEYAFVFIEEFNDKEVGFVIVHENLHKAARHMTTYKMLHKKNHVLTNAACDYWINLKIRDADPQETIVAMPRRNGEFFGLIDERFRGKTVLQIFHILEQEQNEGGEEGEGEGGEGEGEGQGKGKGKGKGGNLETLDDHDWDSLDSLSEEEAGQLEEDIKQAIRQGQHTARKAGVGGGDGLFDLEELVQPKVNWEKQMREYIRAKCAAKDISSWRKPNRRFLHQDIIMPTLEGERIRELVAACDTSGSMFFDNALSKVMAEVVGIATSLRIEKLHVLYWDGKVEKHETYDCHTINKLETTTQPTGGGGTTPACVPKYLKEKKMKPDCVVMLTDGEVWGWGEWDCPVLWAIYNREQTITAPIGKTIQIEEV